MKRDSARRNVPIARSLRWSHKKVRAMGPRQLSLLAADNLGYRLARLRGKLPPRPTTLWIETTNHCNMNCLMCDRDNLNRRREHMEWPMFERVVDEAVSMGIRRIKLNRFGEPLLHPDIHRMVTHVKSRGVPWVFFASNGTLLDAPTRERILKSGLDLLVVSIDGHTPETYGRIRSGASLEEVSSNVEELLNLRTRRGRKQPFVQINMVLMKDNEAEAPDLIRHWEARADYVNIRTCGVIGTLADRSVVAGMEFDEEPSPCFFLDNSMLVLAGGEVTVCCADYNGQLVVGDVNRSGLGEIWRGESYRRLRELMHEKRFDALPAICSGCLATQKLKIKALAHRIHKIYDAARQEIPT
jgi:MoaA/NifB/PqqE/SkfB family radical SAM enzyme